jgi:hypothetical protein
MEKKINKLIFLKDLLLIYFINLLFLIIFFNFSAIDMECDTSLSYAVGRTINQLLFGGNNDWVFSFRPPGYPIFLVLSGVYFFNSFWAVILSQSLLTFISLTFIYYSFNLYKRFYAVLFSIIYILSLFLYTHIKGTTEMHFTNSLLIISFCSIIIFLKKEKIFFYYLSILLIIIAVFTRADTAALLLTVFIFINYILLKSKVINLKNKIKNFSIISSIIFFVFLLWFLAKGFFFYRFGTDSEINNKNIFIEVFKSMSFNHQEGAQLFWKVQNFDRIEINKKYHIQIKNYLDVKNGPKSQELYNVLLDAFQNKNVVSKLLNWKGRMMGQGDDNPKIDTWAKHYGELENNPKKIVDRIFDKNFESYYYPDQIREILAISISRVRGDKLLKAVSKEIIKNNEKFKAEYLSNFILAYGLYYNASDQMLGFSSPTGVSYYNFDTFNGGNCPKIALTEKMFNEYKNEYEKKSIEKNSYSKIFKNFVDRKRDIERKILSLISIISLFLIFFYKEKFMPILLNTSFVASNLLVSNYIPPTFKVENYFLTLLIFNMFYFFIFIKEKNFFLKKNW